MIIHHAGGLHVGVADGGHEALEATLFHVLADGVGNGGAGWQFVAMIDNGLASGHKAVQVFVEGAELFLYFDE